MTDQSRLDAIRLAGEIRAAGLDYLATDARKKKEAAPKAPLMPDVARDVWLPIDKFDKKYFLSLPLFEGYEGPEKILLYGVIQDDGYIGDPDIFIFDYLYRHHENSDVRFSSEYWNGVDTNLSVIPSKFMILNPPTLPVDPPVYPSPYYRNADTKIISITSVVKENIVWNYDDTTWDGMNNESLSKLREEQALFLLKETAAENA
jgi:hypothetical protein